MILLVLFVFGAVVLGAGAMLSPAIPTAQPRVALAATLALALIVGGTLFYASLFGWDTLVIDYLLFALVVGIFLGGTLSVGQSRAESKGYVLEDAEQGWTGPQDLVFFALVGFIFAIPTLLFAVPFGHVAQGYGYMALTTQIGNSFNTFAPFQPEITYVYSNGFTALTAYLSQQLNTGIHTTQFGVGAVLALLNVWLAYDFGSEARSKGLGRAMGLVMLLGLGVFGLLVEGYFVGLMGLAFTQAFMIFVWRYQKYTYPIDAFLAGLMLGAILVAHHTSFIIVLLGYIPYLGVMWLGDMRPKPRTWLVLAFIVPLIALVATAPWLVNTLNTFSVASEAGVGSPYTRTANNMIVMVVNHGIWLVPMALFGAWLGWQKRDTLALWCMVWIFLLLDFSSTGGIAALFPFFDRFINPRDLAWQGAIIPYMILGGMALWWFWRHYGEGRFRMSYRTAYIVNGALAVLIFGAVMFREPFINIGKAVFSFSGEYASTQDVNALHWLRDNTDKNAVILNFPVPYETDWTPIIAERRAVYFPSLPYAFNTQQSTAIQNALQTFWQNPSDPANADLLAEYGVDYVFVPEILIDRTSFDTLWRWESPTAWAFVMQSDVADAPYLERVFGEDGRGAHIYRVVQTD